MIYYVYARLFRLRFTVNSLCSLVIIVSTNFNIFLLGRQLLDVHATQEAGVVYAKLHAYMSFRICYLYFIMIPVVCGAALRVVSWRAMWMVKALLLNTLDILKLTYV